MSEDARVRVEPVCPRCDRLVQVEGQNIDGSLRSVWCASCGWHGVSRRSMPAVPEAYVPTILKPPVASLFTYDEVLAAVCPFCANNIPAVYQVYSDAWEHYVTHESHGTMTGSISSMSYPCVANDWRRRHPR